MIKNQEEALRYVSENNKGDMLSLESYIENDLIRQFELVGFITRGLDCKGSHTWKVSDSAKSILETVYEKPSFIERLKGLYCHYFLNI